ncbi:GNAT family N-acetyltransferase [Undibacterium sp. TJN25]|uniref:GNAT family N-acetyltransferase n=1 Tax=Undibacterium sp. TJN25 TaxID=3413056 RepID=UPI003BF12AB1
MNLHFANFPVLKTARLVLRQLVADDAADIHRLRADPAVNAFIGRPNSASMEDARKHIRSVNTSVDNRESLYWAIDLQGNSGLVGTICYWNFDLAHETVEIGYEMLPEFQGRGLMQEAAQRVIAYGFGDMDVKTITAFPSTDNVRSVALLEKLHFKADTGSFAHTHGNVDNLATYVLTPASW